MNATLEQQIAELTAKHNFNLFAESISNGVKFTAVLSGKSKFISFYCKDISEAKMILNTLIPVNKTSVVSTAGSKNYKEIDSPYKLSINNPVVVNQYSRHELEIQFHISECEIWVKVPLHEIKYDFVKSYRKVNETELHYFPGMSRSQIGKLNIPCYNFNSNYIVNFSGGQKTLFCGIETENIINLIKN